MSSFKRKPSEMSRDEFMAAFSGIYEHSPWVAEAAWEAGNSELYDDCDRLAEVMAEIVATADVAKKKILIFAHPDLAGKAAVRGELTEASTSEQSGAGLGDCSAEEFERFERHNAAYKEKFGFPFIKAVKNSNRHEILAGFEERLQNNAEQEFKTALAEIDKIARFRLMEL